MIGFQNKVAYNKIKTGIDYNKETSFRTGTYNMGLNILSKKFSA